MKCDVCGNEIEIRDKFENRNYRIIDIAFDFDDTLEKGLSFRLCRRCYPTVVGFMKSPHWVSGHIAHISVLQQAEENKKK